MKEMEEAALLDMLIAHVAGIVRVHKSHIDPAKNFDEYGLDSIDAVIATDSIGRQLGIELPPEFLFRNNNINAVVHALLTLRDKKVPDIEEAGENRVLFFPGAGGRDEPALVRFREQFAETTKFQLISIGDWRAWIGQDFDSIIKHVCRQIDEAGVNAPLWLAGYSQGGLIAFATALALERAGRPIRFVGLIDSLVGNKPTYISEFSTVFNVMKWLTLLKPYASAIVQQKQNSLPPGYLRARAVNWLWQLRRAPADQHKLLFLIARHGGPLFWGRGGVMLDAFIGMRLFNEMWSEWMSKEGESLSLRAPAVMFRSAANETANLSWAPFCTDLEVISVPGDHHTMFEVDHLECLVARFINALSERGFYKGTQTQTAPHSDRL